MNQQEMADLLEIQQLAARYMAFTARKEKDRWLEVFTPDRRHLMYSRDVLRHVWQQESERMSVVSR